MLSSVLPGFREVRTPLAAGYIWLINIWLSFSNHLPTVRPAASPITKLWDLGNYAGKGALLAAVTFLAYLVGAFLEIDPHHLWERGGRPRWLTRLRNLLRRGWFKRVKVLPVSSQTQRDLMVFTVEDYGYAADPPYTGYVPHGIMREERQLATRLQAANVDLFNRYDRLLAESAFRLNVTPPLIILAQLVVWQVTAPIWLKFLMASVISIFGVTFVRQAVIRAIQSRDIIAQAIVAGVVRSRFLDRLNENSSPQENGAEEAYTFSTNERDQLRSEGRSDTTIEPTVPEWSPQ